MASRRFGNSFEIVFKQLLNSFEIVSKQFLSFCWVVLELTELTDIEGTESLTYKGFIRPPEAFLYPDSPPHPLGTIRVAQPWAEPDTEKR